MPFINSKITTKLTKEKKDLIKSELGKIITNIPGKSENEYSLYFRGEELQYGAFVEVKIFGKADKKHLEMITKDICNLYEKELNIPQDCIYVKYEEVDNWGFNGFNF